MSCIELPKPAPAAADPADTSWSGISKMIRAYAATQQPGLSDGLNQWADFIDGIAELQRRTGRR